MLWEKDSMRPVIDEAYTMTIAQTTEPTAELTNMHWDFSELGGENAVNSEDNVNRVYNSANHDLDIHIASGDSIIGDGIVWSEPSGTHSDNKTTVNNNRYVKFTAHRDETLRVTYKGSTNASNKYPSMYVLCGSDLR